VSASSRRRARPPPRSLYRYIWRTTARSQIVLALFSVAVFLLDLGPLELQRRIVNDAIYNHAFASLAWLCAAYGVVAVLLGLAKLAMNVWRSRISETANRRLRLDTYDTALSEPPAEVSGKEGISLSIILTEVESVGGFVGTSISDPVLHGGVLLSVFGYLLYLQPWMAVVALLLLAPQFIFVPLMQNAINERTRSRIQVMRKLSVDIVNETAEGALTREAGAYRRRVGRIYDLNMQIFRRKFSMNFLMNFLHHFGIVGILFVGGWLVLENRTQIGTIVAFISGLNQVKDPWGDLVNFFRDMTNARVKYRLIAGVLRDHDALPART
jgi:ABC-type bacteriocin/lantibiotic exporter with double-glycine peptidase domain